MECVRSVIINALTASAPEYAVFYPKATGVGVPTLQVSQLESDQCVVDYQFTVTPKAGELKFTDSPRGDVPYIVTSTAVAELRGVVCAIKQSRLLASASPEFDALLDRAVAYRGTPADIEAWAKRLAGDIADLTD